MSQGQQLSNLETSSSLIAESNPDKMNTADQLFDQMEQIVKLARVFYNYPDKKGELLMVIHRLSTLLTDHFEGAISKVDRLQSKMVIFKDFCSLTSYIMDTDFHLKSAMVYLKLFKLKT